MRNKEGNHNGHEGHKERNLATDATRIEHRCCFENEITTKDPARALSGQRAHGERLRRKKRPNREKGEAQVWRPLVCLVFSGLPRLAHFSRNGRRRRCLLTSARRMGLRLPGYHRCRVFKDRYCLKGTIDEAGAAAPSSYEWGRLRSMLPLLI